MDGSNSQYAGRKRVSPGLVLRSVSLESWARTKRGMGFAAAGEGGQDGCGEEMEGGG